MAAWVERNLCADLDDFKPCILRSRIDATGGKHLWAEYYDRDVQDIFAVQDEITQTIVATLAEKIDLAERERATRRPMTSLQAYELHQRGRQIWQRWTNTNGPYY